jgi:Na+-transporting NADH:ubiquinone oxidoreductase subunit A
MSLCPFSLFRPLGPLRPFVPYTFPLFFMNLPLSFTFTILNFREDCMAHIGITKGLDIPILGKPHGQPQPLIPSGSAVPLIPLKISLNLSPFEDTKFKILVRPGETVKIGQAIAEDKSFSGRMFCSPAAGIIRDVRRGYKRALTDIVIDVDKHETYQELPHINVDIASREQILERLKAGGLFAHIRSRPFNKLADPDKMPRNIFVKAIESAPFVPPAEMQVEGHEQEFQIGLNALAKLTSGSVNLVYRQGTTCKAFTEALNVQKHTASGPHPVGNFSVHIQYLDPIKGADDTVWTVTAHDVVAIGHLLNSGRYYIERIISIAGPGVLPDRTGYFRGRAGLPVSGLISARIPSKEPMRLVSGDPLMGHTVTADDYLGFNDYVLSVIPENIDREFLHFFRVGSDKYSFSGAYLSGHLDHSNREYFFTTNMHGEHRAFVDSSLYDKVMPLPVPTMLLVKAVMAEDFERAEKLGLVEVDSEDFALPTFVCPSKVEMVDIMKRGLKQYAQDVS